MPAGDDFGVFVLTHNRTKKRTPGFSQQTEQTLPRFLPATHISGGRVMNVRRVAVLARCATSTGQFDESFPLLPRGSSRGPSRLLARLSSHTRPTSSSSGCRQPGPVTSSGRVFRDVWSNPDRGDQRAVARANMSAGAKRGPANTDAEGRKRHGAAVPRGHARPRTKKGERPGSRSSHRTSHARTCTRWP